MVLRPTTESGCEHGGAFWSVLGDRFDRLGAAGEIVAADVLDAWFPPAPSVIDAVREHLPLLLRTSPPTGCEGLVAEIARARGVDQACILPGDGSSALIFRAFGTWLSSSSRVLVLDPMYGEYLHVAGRVIGASVDTLPLSRDTSYDVIPDELAARLEEGYDLVALVNPNSPTGRHLPRRRLESVLREAPAETIIWIDETYVDYVDPEESLERSVVDLPNVVVCKSMSKVYALSGARVAYLCARPELLTDLRAATPPWAVSLPAQVAAVAALAEPDYYAARHAETRVLREHLQHGLRQQAVDVVPGVANFLLCHLPVAGPTATDVCERCRAEGVFLRDMSTLSALLGRHAVRVAVREGESNRRAVDALTAALNPS